MSKTMEQQQAEFQERAELFADAAFPVTIHFQYENRPGQQYVSTSKGLSKREYFAAMAMQGLCANSISGRHRGFKELPAEAILYADNLIEALNASPKGDAGE